MSTANKLSYLNDTKSLLRTSLNKFGSSILSTDTFRSYDTKLNDIYDKLPKVTQSGAGFTLLDVQNGQVDDFKMIGTDLYQNQLPSEYTAVEYLQSDNKCYIDTGINADYKLSLKLKMACLNTTQIHMGAIKNNNGSYIRHHLTFNPTNPKFIGVYAGETNILSFLKEFDNNFHEFNLDIYNKKISIDNDSAIAISYNNFDVGINYYLFARNGSNIEINKGTYKIYYCKMYYEDKLVRDFAPCYRNSDNVAGLYDFVTNTFFTNQGTGTFTVGNTITLPNPDYPQDIKVVEGRQVITDKGKNLLNISKNVNGYWYKNGVLTANADWSYINDFIEVKSSTQYTISRDSSELNESQFSIEEFDENKNYIKQNVLWQNNTNKYSITTDSNTKYVICNYRNGYAHTDLQFESGDNRTDYEQYHEPVDYNIDLQSENLSNGINQNYWLNTVVTNCGNTNNNSGLAIDVRNLDVVEISTSETQQRYRVACVSSLPQSGTTVNCYKGVNKDNTSSSITINTAGYNYLIVNATDLTKINVYYKYELAKMPNTDYKNRIYKNNGNWYFEENVKKIILDGSRNWRRYTSGNYTVFYIEDNGASAGSSSSNPVLSDKFKSKFEIGNNNIFLSTNGNRISISTTIADSIEDWITWLSTHNVIVYYALATPVTTQITNTTLINQLEALYLHTGTNIITISNDNNIIPEIEITRLKELEKLA